MAISIGNDSVSGMSIGQHKISRIYIGNDLVYVSTFPPADEGKVVHNGELEAQTSATYTTNDTYDTTFVGSTTLDVVDQSVYSELLEESWGTPT